MIVLMWATKGTATLVFILSMTYFTARRKRNFANGFYLKKDRERT